MFLQYCYIIVLLSWYFSCDIFKVLSYQMFNTSWSAWRDCVCVWLSICLYVLVSVRVRHITCVTVFFLSHPHIPTFLFTYQYSNLSFLAIRPLQFSVFTNSFLLRFLQHFACDQATRTRLVTNCFQAMKCAASPESAMTTNPELYLRKVRANSRSSFCE